MWQRRDWMKAAAAVGLGPAAAWAQSGGGNGAGPGAGALAPAGTIEVIDYPMFQVGEPGPDRRTIDFFWSPTDVDSTEVYRRLIRPVLDDDAMAHVVNLYVLTDDDADDEDPEDAQIGALMTCVTPARMPDFALSILEHNVDSAAVRDVQALFEASRAFGNRRETLEACLLPRVVAKIRVASEQMRQVLETDDATVLRVDGETIDVDELSWDEFVELLEESA